MFFKETDAKILFGIFFVVCVVVIVRPHTVFRILSYGRYKPNQIPEWKIKFLQIICGISILCLIGTLVFDLFINSSNPHANCKFGTTCGTLGSLLN